MAAGLAKPACVTMLLLCAGASAQWLNYPAPGIPRTPDGKPDLTAPVPRTAGGKPDLTGVWNGPGAGAYDRNITRDLKPEDIQPWAETLYRQRVRAMGKGAPRAACLPDPFVYYHMVDVSRMVQSPQVLVMLYQGTTNSVHRTIFTDGRPIPKDPNPTWMGYSVGHWEGDTLVVETGGFNARSWLDIEGHPHTEALRIEERYHRRDFGHLDLQITIDDPNTFTRPFSLNIVKTLTPDTDLLESVCEEDTSPAHMVGGAAVKLNARALSRYTGEYQFDKGGEAHISSDGNLLFLQQGSNPLKLPLVPTSETVFISRTEGNWVEFTRDKAGAVTAFSYHDGEATRRAARQAH